MAIASSLLLLLLPAQAEAQDANFAKCEPDECFAPFYPAHADTALAYVGTQELGNNRGPEIEAFLASVHLGPGNPYCAAFVSFCLSAPTVAPINPTVRSGLARKFKTKDAVKASHVLRGVEVQPGWVVGWEKGNTVYGHLGIVLEWDGKCGKTVEANTSSGTYGSQRDGDGVWIRERCIEPGNYFRITWFTPVEYGD